MQYHMMDYYSHLQYTYNIEYYTLKECDINTNKTRMWANAQRDGRPAKHRCRSLFSDAKFG